MAQIRYTIDIFIVYINSILIPVEGLVILKELSERLKEEPELRPLNVVITVRIITLGHILSSKNEKTHS